MKGGKKMRNLVILVSALAVIALAVQADATVAYSYDFNEGSGNVLNDSSGNNNNGAVLGGAAWGAGTLIFDGVDDHVLVPYDASMNLLGPVVLEYDLKVDPSSTSTTYVMVRNSTIQSRTQGVWIGLTMYYVGAGAKTQWVNNVATGQWHNVQLVYDGADQIAYVDGVEKARTAIGVDDVRQFTQDLNIGQWSAGGNNFQGELDNLSYQTFAVPEPGILIAGLALLALKRKK